MSILVLLDFCVYTSEKLVFWKTNDIKMFESTHILKNRVCVFFFPSGYERGVRSKILLFLYLRLRGLLLFTL